MDREKMIARHYLDTGILGAYETTEVVWDEVVDGKCVNSSSNLYLSACVG